MNEFYYDLSHSSGLIQKYFQEFYSGVFKNKTLPVLGKGLLVHFINSLNKGTHIIVAEFLAFRVF